MRTFDVSRFHPTCQGKTIIGTGDGTLGVCNTCGVVAHCADVGIRISPASSSSLDPAERLAIAQPSAGVPGPGNMLKTAKQGIFFTNPN